MRSVVPDHNETVFFVKPTALMDVLWPPPPRNFLVAAAPN